MRLGVLLEQWHRVARLEVLGQDEHAAAGEVGADLVRRDQPFVGVGRGHPDVDDRHVRPGSSTSGQHLSRVRCLPTPRSRLGEQARQPWRSSAASSARMSAWDLRA